MLKAIFIQLLLFALQTPLWAQINNPNGLLMEDDNTIKGIVNDSVTNSPIYLADVFIKGTRFGTKTDQKGHYKILLPDTLLHKESIFICTHYPGFHRDTLKIIPSSSFPHLNILLQPIHQELITDFNIPIDSLFFSISIVPNSTASNSFELLLQTEKKFRNKNNELNASLTRNGKTISIAIKGITVPPVKEFTTGPASVKFDLGIMKNGRYSIVISKVKETAIYKLVVSKKCYALKIIKKGFLINQNSITKY